MLMYRLGAHVYFIVLNISFLEHEHLLICKKPMAYSDFWDVVTHVFFFCHAVSLIIAPQNRPPLQGIVLSRNRMQNTTRNFIPLFMHTSSCFNSFVDKIFARKF